MKQHEVVLWQGAQGDILALYSARGEKTYHQIDKALEILKFFPEIAPFVFGKQFRRLVVSKTTLGIFYTLVGGRVMIAAILDPRQSVKSIKSRLKGP